MVKIKSLRLVSGAAITFHRDMPRSQFHAREGGLDKETGLTYAAITLWYDAPWVCIRVGSETRCLPITSVAWAEPEDDAPLDAKRKMPGKGSILGAA